ncbi:hypothetical protein QVD17_10844 [Tagetes erecta]|uniref:Zinc beta-ribbon domain-containing protein n=1 Tax=Tagetes erecta TaxID=13708 RepID=A0AAD8L7C1_TARER|nr:hypothetical protein QVD17_10844 [Tagetes erecta]
MDCNNERALAIKETAEKKFAEKDYAEAKKLAQEAKDLFPGLGFISLFITVIDIYFYRQEIVNGQPNWRAVLGLETPSTLDKTCEKYYNLYEDVKLGKNNVLGAEGALQILSEAFCHLTGQFWTVCPSCQFQFQYSTDSINKEILCFNCQKYYVAVPFYSATHLTNSRTMSRFQRRNVVLALKAPSS